MYKIYADGVLIYDSTLEDYRIGKGQITLEIDKSGSFVFSVFPDHFYYDRFVQMKTVITVYKSGRIVFRGRVLDDVTDYWNHKTITCEGELGFLNDSIIRPFSFEGRPAELFAQFIRMHNEQVDEFKRFKVGTVDIADSNDYIARDNSGYETTQSNLTSRLVESGLGGHIYVTHGTDGTEEMPTIHYVRDFSKVSTQGIEFGVNLKDFTKTTKGTEIATAIIPFGAEIDSGDANVENRRLTIESVNGGKDYVYDAAAVAYRGWIFQTVTWDDVTIASNLKQKAESWLATGVTLATTIELTAIDLHMLDRSIESYNVCEYVPVSSAPHGFAETMLCNRQTLDLLKPENDTVVLGYGYRSFTSNSTKLAFSVSNLSLLQSEVSNEVSKISHHVNSITMEVSNSKTSSTIKLKAGETVIASQEIKLTGFVTFEGLSGGTTTIDGSCIKTGTISAARLELTDYVKVTGLSGGTTTIDGACIKTGTISADRINLTGAIEWGDLNTTVQNDINDAWDMAWYAQQDAQDAVGAVSAWTYGNSTYIDGSMIMSGTVMASYLLGGYVGLLDANERSVGSISISYTSTGYGLELGTDYGGIRISAGGNFWVDAYYGSMGLTSSGLVSDADVVPQRSNDYTCGAPGLVWSAIYAATGAVSTSDRTEKNSIDYDMRRYDALFDSLKPCSYKLNAGTSGRTHIGMISQDVEDGLNNAALTSLDFAGFIKSPMEDGSHSYGLRYSEFIALNIWQIQQLKTRVKELEERINGK